jgi:2,3-bisphosphoglycerate-independent phosphoglycerate mutase
MKGIFVILDGVADLPCSVLGGKTPLEVAKTDNLDSLASKSKIEHCYTMKKGVAPESAGAVVSLFGYDPKDCPRGVLETKGAGVKFVSGDLAFRCNFATIDDLDKRNILDRRAGRTLTTKEAKLLADEINKKVKLPYKFDFVPNVQHRAVLVFRGGFSDNISGTDPAYGNGVVNLLAGEKMNFSKPLDDDEESKLSADLLNSFIRKSFEVLENSSINKERARKGLYVANTVLCRDAGSSNIKLKKLKGKWMGLGSMPLEIGISKCLGMDVFKFDYPAMKGMDVYANLYDALKLSIQNAVKMIKKYSNKYDYFYVHLKETDIPGHDNKPFDKVKMIEIIDQNFFSFLKKFIGESKLVVTADHTTACRKKSHTADPVPVLIYDGKNLRNSEKRFTEKEGLKGKSWSGKRLLKGSLFLK